MEPINRIQYQAYMEDLAFKSARTSISCHLFVLRNPVNGWTKYSYLSHVLSFLLSHLKMSKGLNHTKAPFPTLVPHMHTQALTVDQALPIETSRGGTPKVVFSHGVSLK